MSKQARIKIVRVTRDPVAINPSGAVMSVINQVLNADAVKIALSGYIEGRGLIGDWRLEIQSARLVPVQSEAPNGSAP